MKALCIIPARGGSKRIPRKNIRPLAGKPIIAYPIAAALGSGCFDEVMVSTDDAEIAAIACAHGAKVPFMRSPAAASDTASTGAVIAEVLGRYATAGRSYGAACCLYPTAALVTPARLREGFGRLETSPELDAVMTVQPYPHPIERAYRQSDGLVRAIDDSRHAVRTQDLEPAYYDAGQFYIFRTASFQRAQRMVGAACAPLPLSRWEAVDLDEPADWQWLERIFSDGRGSA